MTIKEAIDFIEKSKADYFTYGESDLGMPIPRDQALGDFLSFQKEEDPEYPMECTIYECDKNGITNPTCPRCGAELTPREIASLRGQIRTPRKAASSAANGKKGGRPKKKPAE